MLVFWKPRLVFLANSRTGSTSIEMALESLANVAIARPPELKHTDARSYRSHLAPFLSGAAEGARFETVAVIREPLDWLASWYRERHPDEDENPAAAGDFEGFVEAFLADGSDRPLGIESQAAFLTDGAGALCVDHLFRYEEIGQLVEFLEDRLGCEITLPRLRASAPAETAISAGLRTRLAGRLAEDRAIWDAARR
ncbi:hypothetical protein V8J36_10465 [Frigidibacter sp. MR17.14]|uniref:hypothetical protein n=1 Tax=Frigidibacter sp. MR17.14 TaxID=3126509 RepID=UPI003012F075